MTAKRLLPIALMIACVLCLAADAPAPGNPNPAREKKSDRVVFAINAEGGALNVLDDAKDNILAAAGDMKKGQTFNIVVGRDLKSVSLQKALVPPTKETLAAAAAFLEKVTAGGANDATTVIAAAARQRPDVIWFVDIGNEEPKDLAAVKKAAAGVRVNTVALFAQPPGDLKATHNLWQIAHDTGGVCLGEDGKPIGEPKEAVQPREIPKGPSIFRE